MNSLSDFFHAFVPLLVAIDAIGVAPIYSSLTHRLPPPARSRMLRASIAAGAALSIGFALLGKLIFVFLGITVTDFQIGGGLVLVALAGFDLVAPESHSAANDSDVGVVPIGVPLIVGPTVITTTIVLVDLYGPLVTVLALLANLAVCWAILAQVRWIERFLGRSGARAVSKIVSLFLVAIGVHLIRQGLERG